MEVPFMKRYDGVYFCGSRDIVKEACGEEVEESQEIEYLLDRMYQVEMATHAWLTGVNNLAIAKISVRSGLIMNELIKNFDRLQRENPDLHDFYEKKKEKTRKKEYYKKNSSIPFDEVAKTFQDLINELGEKYTKNQAIDKERWLVNEKFTRADQMAAVWVKWVVFSNEY